jgi:hypothetical protein
MRRRLSRAWPVLVAALTVAGCGPGADRSADGAAADVGFEVLGIELMAGGDLARLNYRVIHTEKAAAALRLPLKLIPPEGGVELSITSAGRLGPLQQRPGAPGGRRYLMFTNVGRALRPGMQATLAVGPTQVEGIPVL